MNISEIPLQNLNALRHKMVQGWVPSASVRGSSDILYSCLATIFLCMYVSLDLKLPDPSEAKWRHFLRKIGWIICGFVLPEVMAVMAFTQWCTARSLVKELKTKHAEYANTQRSLDVSASLTSKAPTADVVEKSGLSGDALAEAPANWSNSDDIDLTYAFYVIMGGVRIDVPTSTDHTGTMALSNCGVSWLAGRHVFIDLPMDEIRKTNKTSQNRVASLLLCSQVSWMFVQCVAKIAQGYPITVLEVYTFSHVVCTMATCLFLLKKPRNIIEATTVPPPDKTQILLLAHLCRSFAQNLEPEPEHVHGIHVHHALRPRVKFCPPSRDVIRIRNTTVSFLVSGAIHALAWSFTFPTIDERILWCISTWCLGVLFSVVVVSEFGYDLMRWIIHSSHRGCLWLVVKAVAWSIAVPFGAFLSVAAVALGMCLPFAKGYLLLESFLSLRAAPVGVYVTVPWSNYIPHL